MIIADNWSSLGKGDIIDGLLNTGYEVICIIPDSGPFNVGENKNLKFYFMPHNRKKFVPINLKFAVYCLMVYQILKPDKVLMFLSKQTIYVCLAFRFLKNASISVIIGGLEPLKTKKGIFYKRIYKYILSYARSVFFVYKDDFDLLDRYKLGCKERSVLLGSWGVDMDCFIKYPLPQTDLVYMAMPVLCSYGIKCFIETAKLVREKYPKVRFLLSGLLNEDPKVLSAQELDEACESGAIYYIEVVNDIKPYLEVCSIFMQPNLSVREGHIIEAEAAGRPILASDHPTNRSLVTEGYNGFILPVFDAKKWADKIILLLENKRLKEKLADYSHELCARMHDRKRIDKLIIESIKDSIEFKF